MYKLYQKSWHSVEFKDLGTKLSKENLPGEIFYEEFYKKFNEKYNNLDELDNSWLNLKKNAASEIFKYIRNSNTSSLVSLGAGLCIIEKVLHKLGLKNLYIQEVSESVTIHAREFLNPDNVYIGNFPDCIKASKKFDYILLGGIEYLFDDEQFTQLLINTKKFMKNDSKLIILSWSIEETNLLFKIRLFLKEILIKTGCLNPGQFWGYCRTLKELINLITATGFEIELSKIDQSIKPWKTGFILVSK